MQKSISIVVPIYNVERYLEKCVLSLVNQTITIKEIILVDDGSKDQSGVLADKLAQLYNNVIVIHQMNGGLSVARNTGIDVATGDYIGFVDSDDYVDHEMYETLLVRAERENADISICGVVYEQENGDKYNPYPDNIQLSWDKEEALTELNSYKYFNMSFCDALFNRRLFEMKAYGEEKLRFPVGKICEDYYLMHRVVARAEKVTYTSQAMYHYIQRNNSISRNDDVSMAQVEASLAQLTFYSNWFPSLVYVAETASAFSHMGIYSAYIRKQKKCHPDLLQNLKMQVKKFLKSILLNSHIPKIKKVQAITFCYATPVYKMVIARTRHR